MLQEAEWNAVSGARAAFSGHSAQVSATGCLIEQKLLQIGVIIITAGALHERSRQNDIGQLVPTLECMAAPSLREVLLNAQAVRDLAGGRVGIGSYLEIEVVE